MGRRVRANGGSRPPENGPVEVRHVVPPNGFKLKPGWTLEQALDLLAQGYGDEQVAFVTGLPLWYVRQQSVPRTTLLERAKQLTS